jgi:hypothetical protein
MVTLISSLNSTSGCVCSDANMSRDLVTSSSNCSEGKKCQKANSYMSDPQETRYPLPNCEQTCIYHCQIQIWTVSSFAVSACTSTTWWPLVTSCDMAVTIDLLMASPTPCNPCLKASAKYSGASARASVVATACISSTPGDCLPVVTIEAWHRSCTT